MKGSIQIIGGKADGQTCSLKAIEITLDGERYLLIHFKQDGTIYYFYMLAGLVPAEAQKIYLERQKAA